MIRILTLTSLFPNSVQRSHGIFVLQRLKHLVASRNVEACVVAPVPWYPAFVPGPDRYTIYREVPETDSRDGFEVSHPKYLVVPRIGMSIAPGLMAASILNAVYKIASSRQGFDLIDAHYFYPDGVAAAWIAQRLGLPVVITARGTDINLIPKYRIARRQILWAANQAAAIITVCDALRNEMVNLGVEPSKITTLRNGFDPDVFHPVDRDEARNDLGIQGRTLLSVGHLIERKGHGLIIDALAGLPDFNLVIVGSGPDEADLKNRVRRLGVEDRVRFEGTVEQTELKSYYSACDALALASSREGMANVLIESIACGCPVVATNSWGTPEVIGSPESGVLVDEWSSTGIAAGIRELFANLPARAETLKYADRFQWDPTSKGQYDIFRDIAERTAAASTAPK